MSAEAFSATLWACSAYAAVTPAVGIGNRCCPPSVPRSHILSDFISSPHSPFKSLIRLLLCHIVAGRLNVRRARLPWPASTSGGASAAIGDGSRAAAATCGGMALQLARRRRFSSLGDGASARAATALQLARRRRFNLHRRRRCLGRPVALTTGSLGLASRIVGQP